MVSFSFQLNLERIGNPFLIKSISLFTHQISNTSLILLKVSILLWILIQVKWQNFLMLLE